LTDFDKIWHADPIANKISRFQKSRMATAAILKNRNISAIRNDKFWYSNASGLSRYRQQIKIHNFENPRWRRPPSWKIIISATNWPILTKFGTLMRLNPCHPNTVASKISRFQKTKMSAVAILKIRKIAISRWNDQLWRSATMAACDSSDTWWMAM